MATKVHMEALSPTMEEGQVVKWLKSEGDDVSNGEIIAEIETDKATMELVARGDGILRKILLGEGATADVGSVIAVIGDADEDIGDLVPDDAGSAPAASDDGDAGKRGPEEEEGDPDAEEEPEEERGGPDAEASTATSEKAAEEPASEEPASEEPAAAGPSESGRVKASPLARRLAEDEGIPLEAIEGSGPGGRIVKRDVEKAAEEGVTAPAARPAAAAAATGPEYEDVPLSQIRKTIAKRLVESIGPVPHFFLTVDVDMTRVVDARKRINASLERDGVRISFNDIVLKATAMALARHPSCNAHWGGDHIRKFNRVHLGVAVAIEDGLITPVVRNAEQKGIVEISQEVREKAGRAREKKLKPDEYTGSTFSVSNLGMFGIESFTGVINPPEAGILAVGGLEERAVVEDGEIVAQPRMKMTMSCDHRVIDGAMGAEFLKTLVGILEEPLAALL